MASGRYGAASGELWRVPRRAVAARGLEAPGGPRVVGAQRRPARRRHHLGPAAVEPELAVLVGQHVDARRTQLVLYHLAVAQPHRVVQGVTARHGAARAEGALVPVLAVL